MYFSSNSVDVLQPYDFLNMEILTYVTYIYQFI